MELFMETKFQRQFENVNLHFWGEINCVCNPFDPVNPCQPINIIINLLLFLQK